MERTLPGRSRAAGVTVPPGLTGSTTRVSHTVTLTVSDGHGVMNMMMPGDFDSQANLKNETVLRVDSNHNPQHGPTLSESNRARAGPLTSAAGQEWDPQAGGRDLNLCLSLLDYLSNVESLSAAVLGQL